MTRNKFPLAILLCLALAFVVCLLLGAISFKTEAAPAEYRTFELGNQEILPVRSEAEGTNYSAPVEYEDKALESPQVVSIRSMNYDEHGYGARVKVKAPLGCVTPEGWTNAGELDGAAYFTYVVFEIGPQTEGSEVQTDVLRTAVLAMYEKPWSCLTT